MRIDKPLIDRLMVDADNRWSIWHGDKHWRAVAQTGWYLAAADERVDAEVVFLFALLHDTRRENENRDPEHGERAAARMIELVNDQTLRLSSRGQHMMLHHAIWAHNGGHPDDLRMFRPEHRATVGACWDADRLNLWRVGIEPDPLLLSTEYARRPEVITWARALNDRNHAYRIMTWTRLIEAYQALDRERQSNRLREAV